MHHDISEIRDYLKKNNILQVQSDKRANIRIASIDDEPFAPQSNLASYGYRVEPLSDIKKIDEIQDYNIILCDIMGVGQFFDKKLQGASIIKEIKEIYPEKIVIAYTGAALNQVAAREANNRADSIVKKDIEISEWIRVLDRFSDIAIDPYYIWLRIRSRLIEMEAKTKDIIILEDAYVESILSRDSSFNRLKEAISETGIVGDIRSVAQGFVGSYVFKLLLGG